MPANDVNSLEYKILQLDNLHAYLPLVPDNGTSGNWNGGGIKDWGANNYTQTFSGTIGANSIKTDFQERGMHFDADGDTVNLDASFDAALNGASALSFGAWVFVDSSLAANQYIFMAEVSGASAGVGFYMDSSGNWGAGGRSQAADSFQFTTATGTTGAWKFVVGINDYANDQVGISVDGAAISWATGKSFGATTYTHGTPNEDANLGSNAETELQYLNGSLMHFFITKDVLTNSEIADLYSATKGLDVYRQLATLKGASASATLALTLRDSNGAPRANLTGLRWWYYDAAPSSVVSVPQLPMDYGSGATTNASGVFSVTTITGPGVAAGDGYIVITDSDGNPSNNSLVAALPVTLT